jgi:O-antigen ligase
LASAANSGAAGIALVGGLCIAIGLPTLLAYNLPPSPTALNQSFAIGGWGLAVGLLAWHRGCQEESWWAALRVSALPQAALAVLVMAAALSWLAGGLPRELAISAVAVVALAALTVAVGTCIQPSVALWAGLFTALLAAGATSVAIGVLQVFAPDAWPSTWIARSAIPGRAVGNLRQPNHLATLLLWSAVAVVPLLAWASSIKHAAARAVLAVLFALMLFGVVLSGSRTGLLGVAVLVAWGLLDRSLPRLARVLLVTSPLICLAGSLLLSWWSAAHDLGALGVSTRLDEGTGTRTVVWRETLALIARNPWLGVGFGEFNFAWTLTPFAERGTEFFDHTHNLALHLAVELGLPLALLVLGLLAWGLWQAFERSRHVPGPEGIARRAALVMVVLMAWHSQLEYPLWYAYFLLPTAFAWGLCLSQPEAAPAPSASSSAPWMAVGGGAMVLAAALTLWDYQRVVAIFAPPVDDRTPLVERIVEGRHSWFFAHHADYALVTTLDGAGTLPGAFDRAPHFLLDSRLMMAWARGLAARGDVDRARHIAARLREFRNPNAAAFFAPCDNAALAEKPFQCSPPERAYNWRDFR